MPTARTKTNLQRTLLILLGILIAVLLTFNTKLLSSSEGTLIPKSDTLINKELAAPAFPKETGLILVQDIGKKLSSLI